MLFHMARYFESGNQPIRMQNPKQPIRSREIKKNCALFYERTLIGRNQKCPQWIFRLRDRY